MEGPLSIHGNAYELMKLLPNGEQVFDVIRRYERLLARERREGHEPGDALAFIAPFLIHHALSSDDIGDQAKNAVIVPGAQELIASLSGWQVFCITTSYEQYARRIMDRVGIAPENLACTVFPIERYGRSLQEEDHQIVADAERDILAIQDGDDGTIASRLDRFYGRELPPTSLGPALREVKPMGGTRKLAALQRFAAAQGQSVDRAVVVGDSVTDAVMLHAVNTAGGLAVAYNADERSLPSATVGLASAHLSDLKAVLDAWREGGRERVEKLVREKEKLGGAGDRENLHWLPGRSDVQAVLQTHQRVRRTVLQQAGKAHWSGRGCPHISPGSPPKRSATRVQPPYTAGNAPSRRPG